MFTELAPLVAKSTLLIIVAPASGDRLRLTITPKTDEQTKSNLAPLLVEGTASELDSQLPEVLRTYAQKNLTLAESLAQVDSDIAALQKEKAAQLASAKKPSAKKETARKEADPKEAAPAAGPVKDDSGTLSLGFESETESPAATESSSAENSRT